MRIPRPDTPQKSPLEERVSKAETMLSRTWNVISPGEAPTSMKSIPGLRILSCVWIHWRLSRRKPWPVAKRVVASSLPPCCSPLSGRRPGIGWATATFRNRKVNMPRNLLCEVDFPAGGRCFGSKSGYAAAHPGHQIVFNATIVIRSAGKIWHGDIDLCLDCDRAALQCLSDKFGEAVCFLRAMDCRFDTESTLRFEKAVSVCQASASSPNLHGEIEPGIENRATSTPMAWRPYRDAGRSDCFLMRSDLRTGYWARPSSERSGLDVAKVIRRHIVAGVRP
jgi:hypothetical protein